MTTIVATKSMMAADSKTVVGESWFYSRKLYRIGGAIVGVAGDSQAIEKFLAWYGKPRSKKPEFKDSESFAALVLTPKGLFHVDESLTLDPVHDDYFAVGSGAIAALVAMDCGLSPVEAVEAASRRDLNTGGRVETMELP